MSTDDSFDQWSEDFASTRVDADILENRLQQARVDDDSDLRRIILEVQMWRWLAPLLLDRFVPAGTDIDESDSVLNFARFTIRGDAGIGS